MYYFIWHHSLSLSPSSKTASYCNKMCKSLGCGRRTRLSSLPYNTEDDISLLKYSISSCLSPDLRFECFIWDEIHNNPICYYMLDFGEQISPSGALYVCYGLSVAFLPIYWNKFKFLCTFVNSQLVSLYIFYVWTEAETWVKSWDLYSDQICCNLETNFFLRRGIKMF